MKELLSIGVISLEVKFICTTVQYQHSLITWQQPGGHPDLVASPQQNQS